MTDDHDVVNNIDDDGILNISVPITLPLTQRQRTQLKDPAQFSFEEEFYIFYDALTGMTLDFLRAQKALDIVGEAIGEISSQLGIGNIEDMKSIGLRAMYLAYWLGKTSYNIPVLPKGYLLHPEDSLDPKKLAWGREIRNIITEDKALVEIWVFRLDELLTSIQTYPDMCATAEVELFDTPPHMLESHVEYAKVRAEAARHRLAMLETVKAKWMPLWYQGITTDSNGVSFSEDLKAESDKYEVEHKNELRFLSQRKKATSERVARRLAADPEYRKQEDQKNKSLGQLTPSSILEALKALGGGGDCNNPSCLIHGEEVRKRRAKNESQPTTETSNVPTSTTTATTGHNIMASNPTIPTDKKSTSAKERKFSNVHVQFTHDPNSKAIRLPDGMSYEEARHWLEMIEAEETRTFSFEFKFVGWSIMDAMWAVYQSVVKLLGFAHVGDEERHSFFGSWKVPPKLITIPTGPDTTQQIPWGPIEVSEISAALQPNIDIVEGHFVLRLSAEIRNNERQLADKLMKLAVEHLKEHSIYRGQAIEMNFDAMQVGNFASFDPNKAPKFLDLGDPEIDELVLSKNVQRLVDVALWTPIRKTAEAKKHKIPLRRTVTLAGPHGVGKTLTALATAKIATQHGWTFLYLRDLSKLKDALYFAKNYSPCVVFAEDVDTIVSGERDEKMNEVFNVVDGVDRKGHDVMLVFSTNCIEDIHQGMLRPGRTDTVIPFAPPDGEAVERLMRIYGRGIIDVDANLTAVAHKLAGQIPAIIREAVEYSKLAAINDSAGGELVVRTEHLEAAVSQMLVHAELLRDPDPDRSDMEVLGEAIGRVVVHGLNNLHKITPSEAARARGGVHQIIENLGSNNHTTPSDEA